MTKATSENDSVENTVDKTVNTEKADKTVKPTEKVHKDLDKLDYAALISKAKLSSKRDKYIPRMVKFLQKAAEIDAEFFIQQAVIAENVGCSAANVCNRVKHNTAGYFEVNSAGSVRLSAIGRKVKVVKADD